MGVDLLEVTRSLANGSSAGAALQAAAAAGSELGGTCVVALKSEVAAGLAATKSSWFAQAEAEPDPGTLIPHLTALLSRSESVTLLESASRKTRELEAIAEPQP